MATTVTDIIEFFYDSRPRLIWEIDKETLTKVRHLKDDAGVYLWKPEPNYEDMPGTFLGIEISISKNKCFQLRSIFSNGESQISKPEFII